MKNSLFLLLLILSCGTAYALSQDWPCFGIEVEKYATVSDADGIFEYAYKGEKKGYKLDINLSGFSDSFASFANCGTSGCFGTITEIATGRTESLRFFCEEYNDDYTKVICHVGFAEEAIFDSTENGNYVVHYCSDDMQKTLRFSLSDCKECHCNMYWYDGEVKNTAGHHNMACKNEGNKVHCFDYSGYEFWRDFRNEADDYENCIGLNFRQ